MVASSKKTSVITGATDGIGLETAYGLAKSGGRVVLVSRDDKKCELVCRSIKKDTGNEMVSYYVADLSSIEQTKALCERIRSDIEAIDVLVNNVGAVFMKRSVNSEGIERTFALNHLSYFTMANELIDNLKMSGAPRVINVSSGMHFKGEIDFNNLQLESGYKGLQAYSNSKLMNVLFSKKLSRLYAGAGLVSNALHPGFVATKFGHNHNIFFRLVMKCIQSLKAISPRDGAQTTLYLSTDEKISSASGDYFYLSRPMDSHDLSYDHATQDRLWDMSAEIVYG